MTVISEPGLYSLILRSRKPEAKAFKRWVTHEVLPSIRRHGVYATESMVDAMLADPEAMIRTLTALKEERAKRAQLEAQAEADAPKVRCTNAVESAQTDILIGDLAKILRGNGINTGQKRLFEWMRGNGYLIKRRGSSWNMPTQKAMDAGLFKVKEPVVTHPDGHTTVHRTTKVTGRGQTYFITNSSPTGTRTDPQERRSPEHGGLLFFAARSRLPPVGAALQACGVEPYNELCRMGW